MTYEEKREAFWVGYLDVMTATQTSFDHTNLEYVDWYSTGVSRGAKDRMCAAQYIANLLGAQ